MSRRRASPQINRVLKASYRESTTQISVFSHKHRSNWFLRRPLYEHTLTSGSKQTHHHCSQQRKLPLDFKSECVLSPGSLSSVHCCQTDNATSYPPSLGVRTPVVDQHTFHNPSGIYHLLPHSWTSQCGKTDFRVVSLI